MWREIFLELKDGEKFISQPTLKQKIGKQIPKTKGQEAVRQTEIRRQVRIKVYELQYIIKKRLLVRVKKIKCNKCNEVISISTFQKAKRSQRCLICQKPINDPERYIIPKGICVDLTNCFHELWMLGKLLREYPDTFFYLPQTDIYYSDNRNDKNEIDLICVCEGKLIIGEMKNYIDGFDEKTVDKLIKIACAIRPDIVVMGYNKGEESCIYKLIEKIKLEGFEIEIVKIFSPGKISKLN